jgi:hypothetical protein
MPWQAKPSCAKDHIAAIERLVNSFPPPNLALATPDRRDLCKEECNRRLCAFASAEGFDIIRNGGDTGSVEGRNVKGVAKARVDSLSHG